MLVIITEIFTIHSQVLHFFCIFKIVISLIAQQKQLVIYFIVWINKLWVLSIIHIFCQFWFWYKLNLTEPFPDKNNVLGIFAFFLQVFLQVQPFLQMIGSFQFFKFCWNIQLGNNFCKSANLMLFPSDCQQ